MDLLIRNGSVYDGTGRPPAVSDVAVAGGRIAAVGAHLAGDGAEVLDAAGLCVAPGFIDLHTHSDRLLSEPDGPRDAANHLRQGVTTIVTGNCGAGRTDVEAYFADLDRTGAGVNVLHLVGHGDLREAAMAEPNGQPTGDEMDAMKGLLARGLAAGAAGVSTGLLYFPGAAAETEELIELAKVAGASGRLYASHIRNESAAVCDAVAEVIRIGREAGCRVQISHFKTVGPEARGLGGEICRLVEEARADGVRVAADQYPYTASSTDFATMVIPKRARPELDRRLAEDDFDEALRAEMAAHIEQRGRGEGLLITRFEAKREWEGMTVRAVAEALGVDPVEACLRVLKIGNPTSISFGLNEEDMQVIMPRPYVATGSDGSFCRPDAGGTHPRAYGTFPRKIAEFARDRQWLSVEQAIRSATGLPADILGLSDRGHLRPGCVADVAVFDLQRLTDRATYTDCHQYATGFVRVLVAGQPAVVDDEYTGLLAGRPVRLGG